MAKAKATTNTEELDTIRTQRAGLVEFVKFVQQWARFNDHALKCKAIAALKVAGEDEGGE